MATDNKRTVKVLLIGKINKVDKINKPATFAMLATMLECICLLRNESIKFKICQCPLGQQHIVHSDVCHSIRSC